MPPLSTHIIYLTLAQIVKHLCKELLALRGTCLREARLLVVILLLVLICGACTRADLAGGGGDDSGDSSRRWTYAGLADVAENDYYLVDAAEKDDYYDIETPEIWLRRAKKWFCFRKQNGSQESIFLQRKYRKSNT